jgi:hypothetical protein
MLPAAVTGIAAAVSFTLGFVVGQQVFAWVLRKRRERQRVERRALNDVWRYLYKHHGITKPAWVAHILDKDDVERRQRRQWFFSRKNK